MQVKAISVFLQALRNEIFLENVNKTFFPIVVDPITKVSPELIQFLHLKYPYKLQQESLLYLLVDPLVADIDMPRTRGLQGVEYGQPGVLAVRMDEQRCSL